MARIKVEITDVDYDGISMNDEAMPQTTITLEAVDILMLNQLEGLFKAIALAAGFDYVGRCVLQKRVSSLCDGDEVCGYERQKLEALLREDKVEDVL